MMRITTTAAALLLISACATVPPPSEPMPIPPSNATCDAAAARPLVGRTATSELGAEALRLTGARGLRWIQPGQAVTMDYRPDRLNVSLDSMNRVVEFSCG